jgi:hypothetical protein
MNFLPVTLQGPMVKKCFDRILRVFILGKGDWHARLEKLARDKYTSLL